MKRIAITLCAILALLLFSGLCVHYMTPSEGTISNIQVNGEIYDIGEMSIFEMASTADSASMGLSDTAMSLEEIKNSINIDTLICPFEAKKNTKFRLESDGDNWAQIEAEDNILVDGHEPSWVNWKAELLLSAEQAKQAAPKEYLGDYEVAEKYAIDDTQVLVIKQFADSQSPCFIGIFIKDGIRYTYTAHISLDLIKDLINSALTMTNV